MDTNDMESTVYIDEFECLRWPGVDVAQCRRHVRGEVLERYDNRHGRRAVDEPGHRHSQQRYRAVVRGVIEQHRNACGGNS